MKQIASKSDESAHENDKDPASQGSHGARKSPPDTVQAERDMEEKRKHSESECALESSQEKNPVPRGMTR